MAIKYMTRVHIPEYEVVIKNNAWEYDDQLSSPGNGNTVIVPAGVTVISVTLGITTGSGKIQTTTNLLDDVISNTGIVWQDWDDGVVTDNTQDYTSAVTAIRQVNVSGTSRMMLRGQ